MGKGGLSSSAECLLGASTTIKLWLIRQRHKTETDRDKHIVTMAAPQARVYVTCYIFGLHGNQN